MDDSTQRVPPGETCPDCKALVADLDAHELWHSRLVADLATAVERRIQRTITPAG
jgi:hypothetical protein